ncbi:MAG: hypothetical protein AB1649_33375, partial [Chloroflexota bacterium]
MKRLFVVSVALMLALNTLFLAGSVSTAAAKESKILEFGTMIGVPRPYTGGTNAIRGVPGGGLPWVISVGRGELKQSGEIEVTVRGLVFDPNDPDVIARGIGGTNTVPNFKAIVSCMSKDVDGNAITVNVST